MDTPSFKEIEDKMLKSEGQLRGIRYSITDQFSLLFSDVLINSVIAELRTKYE